MFSFGVFLVDVFFFNRQDPEVADWVKLLRQRYTGLKLIVGRDKLDEIQVRIALTASHEI